MTIKEIELLSGMERSNIRFYEKEGLITPDRMDNGYRNYSQEELELLLRIKLLRSLHISLDEIKALKDGNKQLSDTLSKQIAELEKGKQDISYAQQVCLVMKEDEVTFKGLDAKKYLDGISQKTKESDSSYFAIKGDMLPQVFYPWRRFLARALDLSIYSILWSITLIFVFQVNLASRGNLENIFDGFIAIIIMLFVEPIWLCIFGTTPGKVIFGLRIENGEGSKLSYKEGFERTRGVLGTGMGYNIPIFNIIRLWKSYKICAENETQPWDDGISYTIKDTKAYRGVLLVVAHGVIFTVLAIAIAAQYLPPNRGDLTVTEFVENYNYYAQLLEIDFGNEYLDENGQWNEKAFDGVAYVEIGTSMKPEYNYKLENGYLKGVSFMVELQNEQDLLGSYNNHMVLISLSYACAQEEIGLFSNAPKRIIDNIIQNTFKNYNFTESGVEFTCQTEYSEYIDSYSGILIPKENAEQYYFKIEYTVDNVG